MQVPFTFLLFKNYIAFSDRVENLPQVFAKQKLAFLILLFAHLSQWWYIAIISKYEFYI